MHVIFTRGGDGGVNFCCYFSFEKMYIVQNIYIYEIEIIHGVRSSDVVEYNNKRNVTLVLQFLLTGFCGQLINTRV